MKLKLLPITLLTVFFLWVLATVAVAQDEVPAPYAGLKNPFPWSDTAAQEGGEKLYRQTCLGCHGADGGNIAEYDFSAEDSPPDIEERADYYFWVVSEGRLGKGMPAYKSSFSEEQRWQVLTYLWSLGKVGTPVKAPPATKPPAAEMVNRLLLTAPGQAPAGQPLTLTATLQDSDGKPVKNAVVKFFIKVDFFTNGLMEIGEAMTNDDGVAVFQYTPRQPDDIQILVRHEATETTTTISLLTTGEPFYQAETGIKLPAPGEEVFIGPESALALGEGGEAPTSAFRLPDSILSWLMLFVVTVILIWATYFRVMYQLFRIPIVREIRDTDTRLVPLAGLAIIIVLGIVLVLMLITGPYSHFHLLW